jgi:hypothetical protein
MRLAAIAAALLAAEDRAGRQQIGGAAPASPNGDPASRGSARDAWALAARREALR